MPLHPGAPARSPSLPLASGRTVGFPASAPPHRGPFPATPIPSRAPATLGRSPLPAHHRRGERSGASPLRALSSSVALVHVTPSPVSSAGPTPRARLPCDLCPSAGAMRRAHRNSLLATPG